MVKKVNEPVNEAETSVRKVRFVEVTNRSDGQRIDNFLLRELGNVPRSLVYKILRKGEVRVDKKRVKPSRKLKTGETVRIPPVRIRETPDTPLASQHLLQQVEDAVVLEDNHLIILDKPAGVPVHSGSGYALGLIEIFRQLRPNLPYVELAHRLDKDTSGIVLLAKSRQSLQALHALFKKGGIDKRYLTLVAGRWQGGERHIKNNLVRTTSRQGKMRVSDAETAGKHAESIFTPRERFRGATLLEVKLLTGRMHQIRTQLAHLGTPVLGDDRYGDFSLNRQLKKDVNLKRLFLHAYSIDFTLEFSTQRYHIEVPLAEDLQRVLEQL